MKKFNVQKLFGLFEEEWEEFKTKLEEIGIYDQLSTADTVQENDPMMISILEAVPDEVKKRIKECSVD